MRKRKKILKNGNDYFLGSKEGGLNPFTESQPIRKKRRQTIGNLGTGILRPPKREIKHYITKKPIQPFAKPLKSSLSDSAKTQELAKQIADSIQARIDKATIVNQHAKEADKSKSEPMNKFLKGGLIASAFLAVVIGVVIYSKKKVPKLKTAKV